MVVNEVFVGAGTSATFLPEMEQFFDNCVVTYTNGLDKVALSSSEQSLVQLLDNLYIGCSAKVISGTSTTYTTVKSNDRTSFTFTDDISSISSGTATAEVYILSFGAPVVSRDASGRPQLLSDNWLGLVNTITPPNVEVEMKQLNLAVSGTRNFAHQYKGAETVSGGSLDLSLNNGSWLYYALGKVSDIAYNTSSETAWASDSEGFLINTTANRIVRVIGGNEYPFIESSSGSGAAATASSVSANTWYELDTSSKMITYTFEELNGDTLPSFALEVLYDKSTVTNATAVDNNNPNNTRYARIFTGCQVNTMTLNFEEGQELKTTLDLVTRRAYDVETSGTNDYIPRRSQANGASNLQNYSATVADNYPFMYSDGAVKLFGQTLGKVKSGSLTINNNITPQNFILKTSRQVASAHIPAQRTYEISLTLLATDTKIWDELRKDGETSESTGSSKEILLKFTKDTGEEISINLQDYIVQSVNVPFPDDKGPIEFEVTLSARTLGTTTYKGKWALMV